MRKLFMGCAVAGLIVLSPTSEARSPVIPVLPGPLRVVAHAPTGEVGKASWYGIERQGRPTASGELFDKDKLTAAHNRLPLGTVVRITNLQSLASTLVRINDRGPGIGGRVIDVSWEAAKQLGFLEAGLARVEIDVVSYPFSCVQQGSRSRSPRPN